MASLRQSGGASPCDGRGRDVGRGGARASNYEGRLDSPRRETDGPVITQALRPTRRQQQTVDGRTGRPRPVAPRGGARHALAPRPRPSTTTPSRRPVTPSPLPLPKTRCRLPGHRDAAFLARRRRRSGSAPQQTDRVVRDACVSADGRMGKRQEGRLPAQRGRRAPPRVCGLGAGEGPASGWLRAAERGFGRWVRGHGGPPAGSVSQGREERGKGKAMPVGDA